MGPRKALAECSRQRMAGNSQRQGAVLAANPFWSSAIIRHQPGSGLGANGVKALQMISIKTL